MSGHCHIRKAADRSQGIHTGLWLLRSDQSDAGSRAQRTRPCDERPSSQATFVSRCAPICKTRSATPLRSSAGPTGETSLGREEVTAARIRAARRSRPVASHHGGGEPEFASVVVCDGGAICATAASPEEAETGRGVRYGRRAGRPFLALVDRVPSSIVLPDLEAYVVRLPLRPTRCSGASRPRPRQDSVAFGRYRELAGPPLTGGKAP